MNTLILYATLLLTSLATANLCTCPQYTTQAICQNYSYCTWSDNDNACITQTCDQFTQSTCSNIITPQGTTYCYYDGTACAQYSSCSDIKVASTTDASTFCTSMGCTFSSGATSCSQTNCSSITSQSECNSQKYFTSSGWALCYYSSNSCKSLTGSVSCSLRSTQAQCLFDNEQCGWNKISGTCNKDGCLYSTPVDADQCNETSTNGGACQFINQTCVFVYSGAQCSQYSTEQGCSLQNYCSWSTQNTCEDTTCQDKSCSKDSITAFQSGSPSNYIFCEEVNEECQNYDGSVDDEQCNSLTENFYTWNGETCEQCKWGVSIATNLVLVLVAALI